MDWIRYMKNANNTVDVLDLTVSVKEKIILNQVNMSVAQGSITAVVGESGSGKTTLVLSLLGLLAPVMTMSAKTLIVENQSLLNSTQQQLKALRGKKVGFVFQEPLQALDPLFTVSHQLDEVLQAHTDFNHEQRKARMIEILHLAGLHDADQILSRYPHQISGGQRQRVMIALACVCFPTLLIADEPTSSLDHDMQQQILETFKNLNKQLSMTMIIITHDLMVVKQIADQVIVLKDGVIVEQGNVNKVLSNPQSSYTEQLIQASL